MLPIAIHFRTANRIAAIGPYFLATPAVSLLHHPHFCESGLTLRQVEAARYLFRLTSLPASQTSLRISPVSLPAASHFTITTRIAPSPMRTTAHSPTLLSAEPNFYGSRDHCWRRDVRFRSSFRHCCRPVPFRVPRSALPPTGRAVLPDDRHRCRPERPIRWV